MSKKRPRVGTDPLAWIKVTQKKEGKRGLQSLPKEKTTERQTYHLEIDLIKKVKDYAYWQRLKISDVVNQALKEFFKNKKFTR